MSWLLCLFFPKAKQNLQKLGYFLWDKPFNKEVDMERHMDLVTFWFNYQDYCTNKCCE